MLLTETTVQVYGNRRIKNALSTIIFCLDYEPLQHIGLMQGYIGGVERSIYEMADEISKKLLQKELWTFKIKKYVKEKYVKRSL